MSTDPADYTWWLAEAPSVQPNGDVDVRVQLSDGRVWRGVLRPSPDVDVSSAIDAGVRAYIRRDRRWTKRSDRGGNG